MHATTLRWIAVSHAGACDTARVAVLLLVLSCTGLWTSSATAAPALCTTAATLSFGNRALGSSSSAGVIVSNCGDQPLTFTDVSIDAATGPGYAVATSCATGQVLQPGASCTATVTFAPTQPGQTSGALWLRNSSSESDVVLTFYGRGVDAQSGTAVLAFEPLVANFGNVMVGTVSPPLALQIRNDGAAPMTLTAIILNGPQAYDFDGQLDTCYVGAVVTAGASCQLSLHFTPASTGSRVANLVIDSPQLATLAILQVFGVGTRVASAVTVDIVEYHHADFDHYFLTPLANEIALCDAGQAPCTGWVRTGRTFKGYAQAGTPPASVGVCRFFNASFAPRSSHFYALHGLGCEATLTLFPDWTLEASALFGMALPSTSGACSRGTVPVYRLYNNGMGGAPNHRFSTDLATRAAMIAAGWSPEGWGEGVAFCAPT